MPKRTFQRVSVPEAEIMKRENFAEMKRQYTVMRDIAQKRIQRLGQEFARTEPYRTNTYETYKLNPETQKYEKVTLHGFQEIKNIAPEDFATAYSKLTKFLSGKGSTVSGQREIMEKTTHTLNKNIGAEREDDSEEEPEDIPQHKVTKENYWRVIDILNETRKLKLVYDSEKIIEVADLTLEFNPTQFDKVLDNLDRFLKHSGELEKSLDAIRDEQTGFEKVDIDDFLKEMGW